MLITYLDSYFVGELKWEIIKNTCVNLLSIMALMICVLASKMRSSSVRSVVAQPLARNISVDQLNFNQKSMILLEELGFPQKTLFSIYGNSKLPNDLELLR